MLARIWAISFTVLAVLQSTIGAHGAAGMLCLGGDDGHAMAHRVCEASCEHEGRPLEQHPHEHDCGCYDIAISFVDLRLVPRDDAGSLFNVALASSHDWRREMLQSARPPTGPPPALYAPHAKWAALLQVRSVQLII